MGTAGGKKSYLCRMAHAKVEKTNAARLLDRAKIAYELVPYEVDESDLAATHVAAQLGEPIERVFKTLVLKGDRTVDLIPMKELLPVTGYIRGGCSPVGMKKAFPTWFHATAADYPFIYVSAGVRGLQLKVAPSELIAYVRGSLADISRKA